MNEKAKKTKDLREQYIQGANRLAETPIDITRYRNERNLMALPLFSAQYASTKAERSEDLPVEHIIHTSVGVRTIKITPNVRHGMPTQVDANILRFAISKGREVHHKTGWFPDHITVSRYELCRVLGLRKGGSQYRGIEERLHRLSSAHFEGNIFDQKRLFSGTLVSFEYTDSSDGESPIRIVFNTAFRKYLEAIDGCLSIPDVLKLKSPLQIRLIEFLRLHMGDKSQWVIGLEKLRIYCGLSDDTPLKRFKAHLVRVEIPYTVSFSNDRKLINQKVLFARTPAR
jgi:hypothetical protein